MIYVFVNIVGIINKETSEDYMAMNNRRRYIEFLVLLLSKLNFTEQYLFNGKEK